MCRASKLTYEDRKRLSRYAARLRADLAVVPELKRLLPKTMHPVLSDLQESAQAVVGFVAKSIEQPPQ